MVESITLYTAKICPYAQRAELALEEAGAKYTSYQIDLQNKPVWYAPQVNPASKVPAVAYGGPPVPPEQPSPESAKIPESLVIVEFVADLFPESTLLPKDPVQRAKARYFVEIVGQKLTPAFMAFVARAEPAEGLFKGVEEIQKLLPDNSKYAISDNFTTADAAIAPFLARIDVALKNDIGAYDAGEGKKAHAVLQGEKYHKFWSYLERLKQRESFKKTFDEEYITNAYSKRFQILREQRLAKVNGHS